MAKVRVRILGQRLYAFIKRVRELKGMVKEEKALLYPGYGYASCIGKGKNDESIV